MAKEINQDEIVVEKAKQFWSKNGKLVVGVGAVLLLLVGGFWAYKNLVQAPKELKAVDAMFKAEYYYRQDSVQKALNGDGQYAGFLKIKKEYGGTNAAKLVNFYIGSCYLKLDDNAKAIEFLEDFKTDAKQIQQRAYKLLGDANADLGKNDKALEYYKKSAHHFEGDQTNSAESLFMAAYLADKVMKNKDEAITLYKELTEKYPRTQQAFDATNYLAQLGVYTED